MKSPKEIGEILKQTRQKTSLTIDKIYNKTRIQPKIIEALEQGTADEVLDRIYVLLFLKKYASFLGLDVSALTATYKTFYTDKEEHLVDVMQKPAKMNVATQKRMRLAFFGILLSISALFILFLGLKVKSFYHARKKTISFVTPTRPASKEDFKSLAKTIFPIPKNKSIELVLRSTDNVWMEVKKDGKIVFTGTLPKNTKKKWSADKKIELWVGKAEALKFTINGKSIGEIGKGKIKNLRISRRSLKIGNKWLVKGKE